MRIAVLILSRGRPAGLVAAIETLHALAADAAEVTYYIRSDEDDPATRNALSTCFSDGRLDIRQVVRPRPVALGAAWNETIAVMDDWDALFQMTDDAVPVSMGWDRAIAELIGEGGLPGFSWTEVNDPDHRTFPVVARPWAEALGRVTPEWFPFWFIDTWLAEVHHLAFGEPMPVVRSLLLGGKRGKTGRMRELGFWFDFFAATRVLRVEEAKLVAAEFGRDFPDPAPALEMMAAGDAAQKERVPLYEKAFGAEEGEASPRYDIAKTRALRWLARTGMM